MSAIGAGFVAGWLAAIAAVLLALGVSRARAWLEFRAQVRTLEKEIDKLVQEQEV
jgi:hypothetical protein